MKCSRKFWSALLCWPAGEAERMGCGGPRPGPHGMCSVWGEQGSLLPPACLVRFRWSPQCLSSFEVPREMGCFNKYLLSHFCPHWALEVSRAPFYFYFSPGLCFNRETAFGGQIFPQETYYPLGDRGTLADMRFDIRIHCTVVTKFKMVNSSFTPLR